MVVASLTSVVMIEHKEPVYSLKCLSLIILSMDFGLKEFGVIDEKERLRRYRRYVYEAGAIPRADGKSTRTIDEKIVDKERKADFKNTRVQRFRYRTRWFTDSGIIGKKYLSPVFPSEYKTTLFDKANTKSTPIFH